MLARGSGQTVAKRPGRCGQRLVEAFFLNQLERRQAGRHRHRVAGQRTGLIDGTKRGDLFHDLASAAEGPERHAAADHLAESGQVGRDAIKALGAVQANAEAGHHLVEDQHRAVLRGQFAHGPEKFGGRHDQVHVAHDRLDDDGGDPVAMSGKGIGELLRIIVGKDHGVLGEIGGNAGG